MAGRTERGCFDRGAVVRKLLLVAAGLLAVVLVGKILNDAIKDFHARKAASIIRT